jgi:uncharacterized RmlC-like cupin family protein
MYRLLSIVLLAGTLPDSSAVADDSGSIIIPKREVNQVLLQGLDRLAEGGAVSDIVVRHLNVGEENLGVSVVQRSKVEVMDSTTGIAHPDLDEIYYIVSGTGTMVTGGKFVDMQSSVSSLLGPMERGEIRGGVEQYVEPGDIAIIPKGMPHGWLKIDTDAISYIIFRGDPSKVMEEKTE